MIMRTAYPRSTLYVILFTTIFMFSVGFLSFAQDVVDPGVQSPSTEVAPAGVISVVQQTLESVQTGSASVDDVVQVVEEIVNEGTPPGQAVNITKYAARAGCNSDQIVESLTMLGDLVEAGFAPGQASNLVKDFIDETCGAEETSEDAAEVESEEESEDDSPGNSGNENGNGGGNGNGSGNGNGNGNNGNGNGNGGGNGNGNGGGKK